MNVAGGGGGGGEGVVIDAVCPLPQITETVQNIVSYTICKMSRTILICLGGEVGGSDRT